MSEMVERVAKAIASRRDAHKEGEKTARGYYDDARAAIEAMREPTEAMLGNSAGVARLWLESDWQAMIDAALGKKP